jgi:hypothetical protein
VVAFGTFLPQSASQESLVSSRSSDPSVRAVVAEMADRTHNEDYDLVPPIKLVGCADKLSVAPGETMRTTSSLLTCSRPGT